MINKKVKEIIIKAENELKEQFSIIDDICEYNSDKVLSAFQNNQVSEIHFNETTGYGYGDLGREVIEKIYADIFHTEDALVRGQFISASHALTVTLFGLLRPNDIMLSISGKPYDTLDSVIGLTENNSSLKSFGIKYEQIDLIDNDFDYERIQERLSNTKSKIKLIEIQRSRGYSLRESISLEKIEKVIKAIREVDSSVIIMIDNCYGELTNKIEPSDLGADILVGSLIKNLGGGIAPNGAYVVGKHDLIELVAERLTLPGEGREVGPSLGMNKKILQGLFMAPSVVSSSLKTAILTAKVMENLGYKVSPKSTDIRTDIVQTIEFGNAKDLINYVQGIQIGSPIDSSSLPVPDDMPGYDDQVIMAAGAFVQGSSIELSCDAPLREPYVAFQQGGLTYEYGKLGLMKAVERILEE
ncbi:MAG: methionine gamma-lyase family protein [Clostridiales bacterium]|jgi:aluminum resistance protein|nr:methionine gamma-lyase family protein [Clostridiales bacterium]